MTISIASVETVTDKSARSAVFRKPRYVAILVTQIPVAVRWSFVLFVFLFPFEAAALGSHSIAKLVGLLFFAVYFVHYNPLNRRLPPVPRVMWWFVIYVAVYIANVVRVPTELFGQFAMRILTLVQLLGFFWIASDLLRYVNVAKGVLLTYSFGAALFAVAVLLGVPGFSEEIVPGRITGAGENPNIVAVHMAIALTIAIGLILSRVYKGLTANCLLVCLSLPVLLAMVSTGSRGGIAAFVIGLCVYLLPYWKAKQTLVAIGVCVLGVIGVGYLVISSPEFLARWEASYYEGKLSERENIFAASIEMISEQPILGWGAVESGYALGLRVGTWDDRDTHNLFFHLLAEGGIVGSLPFLVGLGLIVRHAWQARSRSLGLLPLALLATLLTANLSGNNVVWKPQWLILALATASAFSNARKFTRGSAARGVAYSRKAGQNLIRGQSC